MKFNARTPLRNAQQVPKYTLAQLLECYEQNPDTISRVVVRKGVLQTLVQDARMQLGESSAQSEEDYQYNPYEVKIKQDCGLFANIIKTLEVKKHITAHHNQPKKSDKQRGYTYYFDQNKLRERSTEKYRKNSDSHIQEEQYFERIEIQQEQKRFPSGDTSNKENIRMQKAELFVDMNFSFDEISKQIQSVKQARNEEIAEGDTIVNKIYNKDSYAEEESSKNVEIKSSKQVPKQSFGKQSIKQASKFPLNFAQLSKQRKITQQLPPSERQAVLKTENDSIEGTKKAQSRLISCKQPQSIEIDFDLDINFI